MTDYAAEHDSTETGINSLLVVSNTPDYPDVLKDLQIHFLQKKHGGTGYANIYRISRDAFLLQVQSPEVADKMLTTPQDFLGAILQLSRVAVVNNSNGGIARASPKLSDKAAGSAVDDSQSSAEAELGAKGGEPVYMEMRDLRSESAGGKYSAADSSKSIKRVSGKKSDSVDDFRSSAEAELGAKGGASAYMEIQDLRSESAGGKYIIRPGYTIYFLKADICTLDVGAIVNAANGDLLHGGGVACAIKWAAGSKLEQECLEIIQRQNGEPIPVGESVVTAGHNLPCQYVIHAVGPTFTDTLSLKQQLKKLESTVQSALSQAGEMRVSSVAMPAISCGIFGMPLREGCLTICKSVIDLLSVDSGSSVTDVILVGLGVEVKYFEQALVDLCGAEKVSSITEEEVSVFVGDVASDPEYISMTASLRATCDFCEAQVATKGPDCEHTLCFRCKATCPKCDLSRITRELGSEEKFSSDDDDLSDRYQECMTDSTPDRSPQPQDLSEENNLASRMTTVSPGRGRKKTDKSKVSQASRSRHDHRRSDVKRSPPAAKSSARATVALTSDEGLVTPPAVRPLTTKPKNVMGEINPRVSVKSASTGSPDRSGIVDHSKSPQPDEVADRCSICLEDFENPKELPCKHKFCTSCLEQWPKQVCPECRKPFGKVEGDMPHGTMKVNVARNRGLSGFENFGTIEIHYSFASGTQKSNHPHPGKWYSGTSRTAYLPNNAEGQKVLALLRKAFDQKLTFTVGRSATTGMEDCIVWNGIHHKTQLYGGPYGYPDPTYLQRVTEELMAAGVTE